jgi:hypothetical protein
MVLMVIASITLAYFCSMFLLLRLTYSVARTYTIMRRDAVALALRGTARSRVVYLA